MSIANHYSIAPNQAPAKTIATLLLATIAMGTGEGIPLLNNMADQPYYVMNRLPYETTIQDSPKRTLPTSPDVRTTLEHIENIRHVFDIPLSNIADLLNVSRQAVYKWLAGTSIPEQQKQTSIKKLSQIADRLKEAHIIRAGLLIKMKAFNGRSLTELLLAGEATNEHLIALINEAKIMEASYKKSGLSLSKAKPTNDWQSYISIPGFPEKK